MLHQGTTMALVGTLLLSSCAAAPFLIPVAFEFARNLLQTSSQNYGSKYRDNMNTLVGRLASPYMQNLPPMAGGGPGMPGQPGFQGQPGLQGQPGFPGQPAVQGQPGMPQQQYPGQQAYPGQAGAYDPNNPYGTAGAQNPYGQPASPYGTPSPYGQTTNPYGTQNPYGSQNPYGNSGYQTQPGQVSPYGSTNQQYGTQNPYGSTGYPPQSGSTSQYGTTNPYGAASPNPYGSTNPYGGASQYPSQPAQANPYGTTNPYGGAPSSLPQPGYDPNNPYGAGATAQGYGQTQPGYGQAQPGYGTPSQYGTPQQQQQAYGGYGTTGQPQPYGGQPYGGAGIYPRSVPSEPVAVDVALVRQKQTAKGKEVVLMNDGEVLLDGGGKKDAGDKFKLVVRTSCDCYVYIVSIDGSAWAEPVFPAKAGTTPTPVKKDQEMAFPEGPYWFSLDQVKGIETFYIVASANRRTDLEESMAKMAAETRPVSTIVAKVEEAPVIPGGVGSANTRGIVTVKDEAGSATQVTPLSYMASRPGQDVTVTRWFNHE